MPPTVDIPLTDQLFLFGNCNMIPDQYDAWQVAYDELAEHVSANEPNTLTYYFGLPLEHAAAPSRTDSMLAFEAYRCRADLYDLHLQSPVMREKFLPVATATMTTGLDLTHFEAVGGFLDVSGERTECGVMHDVQVRCASEHARQEVVGALKLLCSMVEAAQAGRGAGAEVLTFIGLRSLDNETGVRIFARYRSREVMEAWQRGSLIKTFWAAVKQSVASMEAKPYAPNGKGWLWK